MSLPELQFRVKQESRLALEKSKWRVWSNSDLSRLFYPRILKKWNYDKFPLKDKGLSFFGIGKNSNGFRNDFLNLFSQEARQAKLRAESILKHRFHFLGEDVQLPNPIDWNCNPVSFKSYPIKYYKEIPVYRTDLFGDIKYTWELNRHQFWIELGIAYYLSGYERFAQKIAEMLDDWIARNPYKIGVNWTSALECAVRIFSWIWAFQLTRASTIWTPERRERFIEYLLLQGTFIEENLSFYYSPYNHLVGEIAALALLGIFYAGYPKAEFWREHYWALMEQEMSKQFHPDGFTIEQASYYHHFTLGFFLSLATLRKQNGLPVSQPIWDQLEAILEFQMHLTRPDSSIPMLGDIDNARSIYFYPPAEKQWDLRFFLAVGAALFNRSDFKYVAGGEPQELMWLLGSEGVQKYQNLESRPPKKLTRFFLKSGYCIFRNGWNEHADYCCFDVGEIAHGVHPDSTESAAHGHADILSFELVVNGKPVIIDPGFHTYFGSKTDHQYFRSTAAHNTFICNGHGQAVAGKRISWSGVSSAQLGSAVQMPGLDVAIAGIDRFAEMENSPRHTRHLLQAPDKYFLIIDMIVPKKPGQNIREIKSFLHFSEGDIKFDNGVFKRNNSAIGYLKTLEDYRVTISEGGERPTAGWTAPGYGYWKPAPVVEISFSDCPLPLISIMCFPSGKQSPDQISVNYETGQDSDYEVGISGARWENRIHFNPERKQLVLNPIGFRRGTQQIFTDALLVILNSQLEKLIQINFIEVSQISVDNQKYLIRDLTTMGTQWQLTNADEIEQKVWE